MSPRTSQPILAALLIVLIVSAIVLGGVHPALLRAEAAQPGPPEMAVISDAAILPRLVLIADPNPAPEPRLVLAPQEVDGIERVQTANIVINYLTSFSPEARTAFEYAVSLWESWITSPVTIVVDASWEPLGTGVLGSAGFTSMYRNFPGAPLANTWFFSALANKLSGSDLNPAQADVDASFNSTFPSWYYGTAGTPGPGQYDLVSVILHEIAHGLGFAGSMGIGTGYGCPSGTGCWGYGTGFPVIYDVFTENAASAALMSFPNNSGSLAAQLTTTNNLYFDSAGAVAANGGNRVPLYAPGTWQPGSSYSHLGPFFDDTPNRLMTYSLRDQEVIHNPGPIALAMLNDMGWAVNSPLQTATSTPTRTITPTPTRTITPTPRFSPTPRNTPSVWRHLPSVLHLSFSPTPRPFSISGTVRFRGSPISGITLSLQKLDSAGNRTQITTTSTDQNGGYYFNTPPALSAGESYYVQYQNNGLTPNFLWAWNTPRTWAGVTGPVVYAPFDIADIPLLSPDDFSAVNFPATFSWQPRPAVISDNYEYDVYDLGTFNPWFASAPLGYTGQYTLYSLPEDNINPDGEPFVSGMPYYWEVWVYGPDGGYGVSLEYRQVTFGPARQGLEIPLDELQRTVEHARQLRMDFRR